MLFSFLIPTIRANRPFLFLQSMYFGNGYTHGERKCVVLRVLRRLHTVMALLRTIGDVLESKSVGFSCFNYSNSMNLN